MMSRVANPQNIYGKETGGQMYGEKSLLLKMPLNMTWIALY